MKELLCDVLFDALSSVGCPVEKNQVTELLEEPQNDDHGDIALPCFSFAKTLKQSPTQIAGKIKTAVEKANNPYIDRTEIVGGYLNFFLNKAATAGQVIKQLNAKGEWGAGQLSGKTVLLEHTSINPNASPHIGRTRNAFIGDAVSRLFKFLGASVDVHYFVNDIGKQISLLVWAVRDRKDITFDGLLDEYIKANEALKADPKIEKTVFSQLEKLEKGDAAVQAAFKRIVDICLIGQTALFDEIGIKFNHFDFESPYVVNGTTDKILELCKKSGKMFQDENGRYVMNLEGYEVEQTMFPLTRGDKTSLYPLRDVCYSIEKAQKKTDMNIIVLGQDQKLYLKQLNAVLDILGYKGARGVHYSYVMLAEGKMSTRAGNVVLLEEVMKRSVEKVSGFLMERHGKVDTAAAKKIGYGAMKYAILKCSANKDVIFDWNAVLNMQGDSSLYLQYNYTRIVSLVKKSKPAKAAINSVIFNDPLTWKILKKVYFFRTLLTQVTETFEVADIANYLYSLAQLFSKWYAETKIADTDNIWVAEKVGQVIKNGLSILGIDVLDVM